MAQYNAFPFQQRAIDEMLESFKNLWSHNTSTVELTLKAPTGSGKTFMTTHFIDALNRQPDWNEDVAFVWITFSDELAMQSKDKFYDYFFPTLSNQLLTIADFSQGKLNKNDILFLNWQKLVSRRATDRQNRRPEDTALIKEAGFYFEDVAENTLAEGRQIIMIIDESHKNVTESAYRDVINPLNPRIIVKVSATPEKEPSISDVNKCKAGWVEVDIKDVIEEGLIKKEIVSQTEDDLKRYNKEDLDILMLDLAIEKREQLLEEWKSYGASINPLVLIQLPDDDKDAEARGVEKKETLVMRYLREKGFQEKEIAVWLSGVPKTEALKSITENNSSVSFLLFKYAAGTGWDCPRAHILVMFREIKSDTFRTQTLGRIRRMAVHDKRLDDFPALQIGYLYTNYSRNEVEQIPETDPNKPKTKIVKMQVTNRAMFAIQKFRSEITARFENRLKTSDKITQKAVNSVCDKVKEKLTEIEHTLEETIDDGVGFATELEGEYGGITPKDRKVTEAIEQVVSECATLVNESKKEIEKSLPENTQKIATSILESLQSSFQSEVRGTKISNFILDPALKTEFISRTNYGDLGKSSEFQISFIQSLNQWFGISKELSNDNSNTILLKNKGVDIIPILSQEIMVNARFKTVDSSMTNTETTKYEMSSNDVEKLFTNLCYQFIKEHDDAEAIIGNASRSFGRLKSALRIWFRNYALVTYTDTDAYKVFIKDLLRNADSKFRPALTQAIKDYYPVLQKTLEAKRIKALEEEPTPFVISTEKSCPDEYEEYPNKLSLVDLYLPKEYNGRKNETQFIDYLEQKSHIVEWWLKNGIGKEDLGFRYMDSTTHEMRLFYPDWIVKYRDNSIGIYDTKGGITAKSQETKDKAECLAAHIAELNQKSEKFNYVGGIVEMRNGMWYLNDSTEYVYENEADWRRF
jgi:DNA or RNA helicases of superfamily II